MEVPGFLLVVCVLMASGCVSQSEQPVSDQDVQGTQINNTESNQSSREGIQRDVWRYNTSIVEVTDGDTVDVWAGSSVRSFRLIGVDTPETEKSVEPGDFENVPDNEAGRRCLREYGVKASEEMEQYSGADVQVQWDSEPGQTGYYDRLLGYIHLMNNSDVEDESFNKYLLEQGLATVYESKFNRSESFYNAEEEAKSENLGAWSCRDIQDTATENSTSTTTTEDNKSSASKIPISISDSTPCQYSEVTVSGTLYSNGEPIDGADISSTWNYKSTQSTESTISGQDGGFSLSRDISRASTTYEVDIMVTAEDFSAYNTTSFTPQSC